MEVTHSYTILMEAFAFRGTGDTRSDVNFEVKGWIEQHGTGHTVASGAQKDG